MLALQIFAATILFTMTCFTVSNVLQRRRTKQFTDYADQLAKEARARSKMYPFD